MSPNDADGMANSVDPDQTSDLGLQCLPRHICPKTQDHYGIDSMKIGKVHNVWSPLETTVLDARKGIVKCRLSMLASVK